MKDLRDKILVAAVTLIIGMLGWYLVRLTDRIDDLKGSVDGLKVAVEVQAGGDPFSGGGD